MKNIFRCIFLSAVISGCTFLSEPVTNENYNPKIILDDMFGLIREKYPFTSFKKINADSLYSFYSAKITSYNVDEIFRLLGDILGELKDGHIYYVMPSGITGGSYTPPRTKKDRNSFSLNLAETYLRKGDIHSLADGRIIYGTIEGNIGYINLPTFVPDNAQWYTGITSVLNYLQDTKGIILDVRNNGGGSDEVTSYIVRSFIDKPFLSPLWLYPNGTEIVRNYLQPNTVKYLKPVVLLQNGVCFSSAEGFISMMKELEQVTTVGDTTGGGSSAPKDFNISYKIKIHLSTMAELAYDRQFIEWNGLVPDILIPQTKSDIDNGKDKQLEEAIRLLNSR